ncbi:MAG TPA: TlpA disulfide reductase family protein [Chitinophagaceae bacterium]
MKQKIVMIFLGLLCYLVQNAQAIKIGERCPDLFFSSIKNYPGEKLQLHELRGKWVILDFWGTGCSVCMKAFPKMDSLQQQFADKLQVLLVNRETKDSTERFFAKHKKINPPLLPMIMGDTLLSVLFPHLFVPHHVWIDPDGIVQYITGGENAHAKNIAALLKGEKVMMNEIEYVKEFDWKKPIIAQQDGKWLDKVEYYSYIMHCVQGVLGSNLITTTRLSRSCASILQLFEIAFKERAKYDLRPANCIQLLVKNPGKYNYPASNTELDKWFNQYSYTYELKVPEENSAALFTIMQQDLQRFFNVTARMERRKISCMVLSGGNRSKLGIKNNAGSADLFSRTDSGILSFSNYLFTDFFLIFKDGWNRSAPSMPLVNETGINARINILIDREQVDFSNMERVKEMLKEYGFTLRVQQRVMDVLIIRDKNNR